ncbi:MAG: hypothetical protein K2L96_03740 [Muribaculaceae bacterium]|nr:hypothetical protein [Muribaculaceae bacterium]
MQAKRRLLPLLTALLLALCATAQSTGSNASARWQPVDTPRESAWVLASDDADVEKIDVVVRDGGQVLITANKTTPIKVFTILGQPVASRTLQPGTMRLRLPLRGIYILKAGETTKRINI